MDELRHAIAALRERLSDAHVNGLFDDRNDDTAEVAADLEGRLERMDFLLRRTGATSAATPATDRSDAVKVTVSDPDTGQVLEDTVVANDFVLVCAGNRYLSGTMHHPNTGMVVLTIERQPDPEPEADPPAVTTIVDGPTPDPDDPLMEHHFYFGHVPRDFNPSTGRSKTHYQEKVDDPESPAGYRYVWRKR